MSTSLPYSIISVFESKVVGESHTKPSFIKVPVQYVSCFFSSLDLHKTSPKNEVFQFIENEKRMLGSLFLFIYRWDGGVTWAKENFMPFK